MVERRICMSDDCERKFIPNHPSRRYGTDDGISTADKYQVPRYILQHTPEWLTTEEDAEILGYHPETVREMLRAGRQRGGKFGHVWLIYPGSVY